LTATYDDIVYGAEDAARVAELLLAADRAAEIPRYLRRGALPEMVERELAKPSNSATSRYSSARDTNAALEKAAQSAREIAPELERRLPTEE
jgi:hypothetical protein